MARYLPAGLDSAIGAYKSCRVAVSVLKPPEVINRAIVFMKHKPSFQRVGDEVPSLGICCAVPSMYRPATLSSGIVLLLKIVVNRSGVGFVFGVASKTNFTLLRIFI